jgi:hypothetical protein
MAMRQVDQPRSSTWFTDLGASRHFTNKNNWLERHMPFSSKDSVIFDGCEEYTIIGKGNM